MEGTRTGEHLYDRPSTNLERHKLLWNKLIGVAKDVSLNSTTKNKNLLNIILGTIY
jgi:hypothetical protein